MHEPGIIGVKKIAAEVISIKAFKYFLLCGILILSVYLPSGCSRVGTSTSASAPAPLYIPLIAKGLQHQYWQAVKTGAFKAARDLQVDVTFEGPEGDTAIYKQQQMFEAALAKKPAAIILGALDSKAIIKQLEQAQTLKIPVICFDSGVDSNIPACTVATDNKAAAAAAADHLAAAIGQAGQIAVICHDNYSATGIGRRDGFLDRIRSTYPQITVVEVVYGQGDVAESHDLALDLIGRYPDLRGIFATNEGSAIGMINAVTRKNLAGKLVLVGFDAGKLQKEAVRSRLMLGAISQDPVNIGYKAVEAAYRVVAKGEALPLFIDTGYYWYDYTNVDSEALKPMLYD